MSKKNELSIYLSFLLRHHPETVGVSMDRHGWVDTEQLIEGINRGGKHTITLETLKEIVAEDEKGRYRFNEDGSRIKACQGHSVSWVEPELTYPDPPEYLYHGTTSTALEKIKESGAILKMERHAVHMQAEVEKAWKSAKRWHREAVVLKIDVRELVRAGIKPGKTDNDVWCAEQVPVSCICEELYL